MNNHPKMDEELEICCTCLSKDRFLYPSSKFTILLAALHLEINTNLGGICWECKSLIERLTKFRSQVVEAQRLLNSSDQFFNLKSYSALTFSKKYYYDTHFDPNTNIQITCTETGPILIKQEIVEPDEQSKEDNVESQGNREGSVESHNVTQKSNELPRITLVQSITEQACERNERFQPITEIIELNIPMPPPILVEDCQKEKEHADTLGGTEIAKDIVKEINDLSSKENASNVETNKLNHAVKETITVKVKLVTEEENDVRIKEEPLSDVEDVQIDSSAGIMNNGAENCSSKNINGSQKIVTKKKQDEIWKRSVMLVYNRLRGHKYAARFAYPITDAIAPEYSKVVKRPMDMNTIRRNIKNGAIRTTAEFQRDLLLMLTNALMYNNSEHSVHLMAKDLITEAQYQLDMLLAIHAQKTLSDDTSSPRIRRRRDSKCCVETTVPAKRPRLSTTPRKTKNKAEKFKHKPKTTPPKNFLTPVKVENIDNIEKYTSHFENTPLRGSRRKSVSKVKQSSSKANKNKSLVEAELEKETKKLIKSHASTTPKVKSEPLTATKITSRRNTLKRNQQVPVSATKITSRRNKNENKQMREICEPISAPKVTSRLNISKGNHQIHLKVEDVFKTPKEISKSKTSRKIKQELILAQTSETKKRRKSVQQENIPDVLDTMYVDDILVDNITVANYDLCVAITNANQRDMTTVQAQNVKRTLEDRILNLALDSRSFAPRFKGKPIIVDGVIKLWCQCKKTLAWLSNTVDKMPRKYGRFVVRKQSELPKKIKSALLVPGFNQVEFIMRLLKAQNSGVYVDSWIVYSSEQRGENMFLVLGIPAAEIPKLSSKGFILAYNLGSITVKFYDASGNLVSSPP